jgi:putative DNA primase/helicase
LGRYPDDIALTAENHDQSVIGADNQTGYARLTHTSLVKVLGLINCEDEPTWHAVANALARAYHEDGRETFLRFSRGDFWGNPCRKFAVAEVNAKYDRSLRELTSKPNGYGMKHLIQLSGLSYNNVIFENTESITSLNCHPVGAAGDASGLASLGGPLAFAAVGRNSKPLQVSDNLQIVLQHHGVQVRYNQISKRCETLVPGLTCVLDETDNTALTKVTDYAVKAGMTSSRIPEMVDALASQNPFCPVQAYIESHPWDGISRFLQFAGQIKSGNKVMTEVFLRKWLIQAVGAAYEPNGISNAGVIVLTGAQGVGKTRLFNDLTSGVSGVFLEGQTLNPADKDSVMSAASHWVVELGELDSTFRKADVAQLKAFITRKQDTLRRPYARKDSSFPRRTVFAGTVNDFQFLHDPTGNRRFWPIDVYSIRRNATINYQQLWAEAKAWYDSGERWYLDDAELALLNQYSETFLVSDPDVEALLSNYDFFNCSNWKAESMNTICAHIRLEKPTKAQTMRLAEAIRKYNGGQRPKPVNGINHHYVPDNSLIRAFPVALDKSTTSGT